MAVSIITGISSLSDLDQNLGEAESVLGLNLGLCAAYGPHHSPKQETLKPL